MKRGFSGLKADEIKPSKQILIEEDEIIIQTKNTDELTLENEFLKQVSKAINTIV